MQVTSSTVLTKEADWEMPCDSSNSSSHLSWWVISNQMQFTAPQLQAHPHGQYPTTYYKQALLLLVPVPVYPPSQFLSLSQPLLLATVQWPLPTPEHQTAPSKDSPWHQTRGNDTPEWAGPSSQHPDTVVTTLIPLARTGQIWTYARGLSKKHEPSNGLQALYPNSSSLYGTEQDPIPSAVTIEKSHFKYMTIAAGR